MCRVSSTILDNQSQFQINQSQFQINQSQFQINQSQFQINQSQFQINQSQFQITWWCLEFVIVLFAFGVATRSPTPTRAGKLDIS